MRIITRLVKPHIRFHKSGLIEILSPAAKIIGLRNYDSISFVIDDNGNLYIKKILMVYVHSLSKGTTIVSIAQT